MEPTEQQNQDDLFLALDLLAELLTKALNLDVLRMGIYDQVLSGSSNHKECFEQLYMAVVVFVRDAEEAGLHARKAGLVALERYAYEAGARDGAENLDELTSPWHRAKV